MNIFFSNRVEELAAKLSASLAQPGGNGGPLLPAPTRIIVPNANLAKWLKLTLAECNGVAMNLAFPYLEKGLWEMVKAVGGPAWAKTAPLEAGLLQRAIAARIAGECADGADSLLARYCLRTSDENAGGGFPQDNDPVRRVWQLAGRLAGLFREYELHRGVYMSGGANRDMIGAWLAGKTADGETPGDGENPIEKAQRELYLALLKPDGNPPLAEHASLAGLARSVFADSAAKPNQQNTSLAPVHIFGMSQLSPLHCWLLYRLADFAEINLYHFNVCREFWEDVPTPVERRWQRIRTAKSTTSQGLDDELDLTIENPLLGAWGKAGREAVKLLADLDDGSGACVVDWLDTDDMRPPQTVLEAVQYGVAGRTSTLPGDEKPHQDRSLQIAGCPGVRREVETVYNSILTNLLDGTNTALKLTDIAVLVPDMETYKPALLSVFGAGDKIPFNLSDSTAATDSVYGKGLLALLDLAGGRFSRRAVFNVLGNPCVMAAMGLSPEDLETWLKWADALGVFHSFDEKHRREQGLAEGWHYTWEQALRRLRLGRIMDCASPADGGAETAFGLPLHEDMQTGGRVADNFSLAVERLYHHLHKLDAIEQTSPAWVATVEALMERFLDIPADRAAEACVRRSLVASLRAFAGQAGQPAFETLLAGETNRKPSLRLPWIRQFIADNLAAIPSGVGAYLTGGVTIASLLPMRPVPFKVVYVMGLTEGNFPGRVDESTLDLRRERRRIGDVSRADAGRYLFLETLMTVKQKLYLTYDNFDAKKDEKKFPCSVVRQLETYLNELVLAEPFREVELPLNSHSVKLLNRAGANGAHTDLPFQWSFAERALAYTRLAKTYPAIGQGLVAKLDLEIAASPTSRRGRLAAKAKAAVKPQSGSQVSAIADIPDAVTLDLKELAKFIEDPALAILQRRMGLYDDADQGEAEVAEDEPLHGGGLDDYLLLKECLKEVAIKQEAAAGSQRLAELFGRRTRRSVNPEGVFEEADVQRLQTALGSQAEVLADTMANLELSPRANVAMGAPAAPGAAPVEQLDAVCLDVTLDNGKTVQATLVGCLDIGLYNSEGRLAGALVASGGKKPSIGKTTCPPHCLLQPLVFLMAARAANPDAAAAEVALYGSFKELKKLGLWTAKLDAARCRTYLENVIGDYLTRRSLDALPYKLIVGDATLVAGIMGRADDAETDGRGPQKAAPERLAARIENDVGNDNSPPEWRLKDVHRLSWDGIRVPNDMHEVLVRRLKPIWEMCGAAAAGKGGTSE